MKKLIIIIGIAISSLLTSCSVFIRTRHHALGAAVGSTMPVPQHNATAGVEFSNIFLLILYVTPQLS